RPPPSGRDSTVSPTRGQREQESERKSCCVFRFWRAGFGVRRSPPLWFPSFPNEGKNIPKRWGPRFGSFFFACALDFALLCPVQKKQKSSKAAETAALQRVFD